MPDSKRTPAGISRRLEHKKQRRAQAIKDGLCLNCFSQAATAGPRGGKRICDECRKKINSRPSVVKQADIFFGRHNAQREEWKSLGLCVFCGDTPVNGKNGGAGMCISCRRLHQSKRSARIARMKSVAIYGGKCVDCGNTDIRVMEFHHINFDGNVDRKSGSEGNVRAMRAIAKRGTIDESLALLCSNCHKIRHWDTRWDDQWLSVVGVEVPAPSDQEVTVKPKDGGANG